MKKKSKLFICWQVITYILLGFMMIISCFPALWMLSTATKPVTQLYENPPRIIPEDPTFKNFITVLQDERIYQAFFNSVIITISVVLLTLILSALAGYGLAHYKFKGSGSVRIMILLGQMVPAVVIIIPLYFLFAKVKLLDTKFALILSNLALTIPMGIIMLSSFFLTIPKELHEAAEIDGAGELTALVKVVLPVAKPGLISVAIYTFIHAWEEFLFALNLTNSTSQRTLPIAISTFAGEFHVDWGATMAAASIVALPVLAIFLLCNKYFVKGMAEGAVKG